MTCGRRQGHAQDALNGRQGLDQGFQGCGQAVEISCQAMRPVQRLRRALTELRSSMSAPMAQVTDASVPSSARSGPMTRSGGMSDRAIAWLFISPTILLLLAINIFR